LRQKLKYRDKIDNKEMTHGIIVTCDTVTTTSHYYCHVARCQLDTWQIFLFFKNLRNSKKNSKNPRTDT